MYFDGIKEITLTNSRRLIFNFDYNRSLFCELLRIKTKFRDHLNPKSNQFLFWYKSRRVKKNKYLGH
jgi:hypothetical protein